MLRDIRKYDTQLKLKEGKELKGIPMFDNTIYYLVGFPRNLQGEMQYVLDRHTDVGYGDEYEGGFCFTDMFSIVLTKEELEDNFEIVGNYEEKMGERCE